MKLSKFASVLLIASVVSCSDGDERTALPFLDTFDRSNTSRGLGPGWDMRGAYQSNFPLPAATDGFISGGHFTYSGDSVVYAVRRMDGVARRIGAEGRWKEVGAGSETTMAMAISANDRLVTDMLHFTATRARWDLTIRRGGGRFEPVASGRFSPTLKLGNEYDFELEATRDAVKVRVPGDEVSTKVPTTELVGEWAFWEQYPNSDSAGVVFDFDAVWADK